MIYDDSVATCSECFELLGNGYTPSSEMNVKFSLGRKYINIVITIYFVLQLS